MKFIAMPCIAAGLLVANCFSMSYAAADEELELHDQLTQLSEYTQQAWEKSRHKLLKVLNIEEEKVDLKKNDWPWKRDRRDADRQANKLILNALDALEISGLTEAREAYAEIEEDILEAQKEIAELQEKRISAPEKSTSWFFSKTRRQLNSRISTLKNDLGNYEQQQQELLEQLRREYANIGIEIKPEQVRFYLSSISGDDIMGLSAVFHNVKQLNQKLEEMMRETPDNMASVKRYYGLHVVMIKAIIVAHDRMVSHIDERYIPRLNELREDNRDAAKQTRKLLENADPGQRAVLQASQRTQEMTARAIDLYQKHLIDLRARVEQSLVPLEKRYAVAMNAYQTIRVASDLVSEMKACLKDLSSLQDMHLPDLLPVNDVALEQKFAEITNSLR